jgi:hypothetical protein
MLVPGQTPNICATDCCRRTGACMRSRAFGLRLRISRSDAQRLAHMLLPSNSVIFNALMSTPSRQRTLMACI